MNRALKGVFALLTLFCFSFAAGETYSEQQVNYQQKFSGLNTRLNPKIIPDDKTPDCSNINLDETGSISERDLFGQYNTNPGALGLNKITGLFKYYKSNAKYFVACAGNKIASGSGGIWTDITNPSISIPSGSYWSAVTFGFAATPSTLYLFNASVPMQKWLGTGNTSTPGAGGYPSSNCSYSAIHKARGWAARSNGYPNRVFYSSLNDIEDWITTGGYLDLPGYTQEITQIMPWGGYFYIFTETSIYVLQGSTENDFALRKTNSQVGAIAPLSVKITDMGIMFLARSGVYAFDGNNSHKLTDNIEPDILSMSKTVIKEACAIYDGTRYWLAYAPGGSSYNSKILLYDLTLKEWYFYDNLPISYFERAYGGTDKGELYGGSSIVNGIVYQLQSSTGTESVTHSNKTDFEAQITFNTVVEDIPAVLIENGNDSYTELLCHFNGANTQTFYTTEDQNNAAVTFVDNAQITTGDSRFGKACLLLDGTDDEVTLLDSDSWTFSSDDFTIDFWVKFNVVGNACFITHYQDDSWLWMVDYVHASTDIRFGVRNTGAWAIEITADWAPAADIWYHIAVVKTDSSANGTKIYVDGTALTTVLATGAWDYSVSNYSGTLRLGKTPYSGYTLNGWIDEPRISKDIARWSSNFSTPIEYQTTSGTFTSQPIEINNAGASALSTITWISSEPTNTKIAFRTRTGETADTVYYNQENWSAWSSSDSITFDAVSLSTVDWDLLSDNVNFITHNTITGMDRDILLYEEEDGVNVDCIQLISTGASAKNDYAERTLAATDISATDWICGWMYNIQSGNTIYLSIGETNSTEYGITLNTVMPAVWEKWYWYVGAIPTTDRNAITKMRVTYCGISSGSIYLGNMQALNLYSTGDVMSSTPNDYLQYMMVEGTMPELESPELLSVSVTYTPELGGSEASLSSYYYTKFQDYGTPMQDKQFNDLYLEAMISGNTGSTIYVDYDIDEGKKTGTLSYPIKTTDSTVRLGKYFPASAHGKAMQLKFYDNDKDSRMTIRAKEVRYIPQAVNR